MAKCVAPESPSQEVRLRRIVLKKSPTLNFAASLRNNDLILFVLLNEYLDRMINRDTIFLQKNAGDFFNNIGATASLLCAPARSADRSDNGRSPPATVLRPGSTPGQAA